MQNYDTIRTDTWIISIPNDWVELGQTDGGALQFESADGSKAMYIATWNLSDNSRDSSIEVAENFKEIDYKSLHDMDGYSWKTLEEKTTTLNGLTIVVTDNLAEGNSYRITGKILARPPIVVRAALHDYACENFAVSRALFAPIIESLSFYEPSV